MRVSRFIKTSDKFPNWCPLFDLDQVQRHLFDEVTEELSHDDNGENTNECE